MAEYWPDDWDDEEADEVDEPEPEGDISWCVKIEYADGTAQDITAYEVYLEDRPEELYLAMLKYFEPEIDDFCEGEFLSE